MLLMFSFMFQTIHVAKINTKKYVSISWYFFVMSTLISAVSGLPFIETH
ncbi:hypothetical protein M2364_002733 [Acinetobacter johnsonii]|nr:hypothetical protein [Acinetobacter johnsonii]